jgi:2,4-dienoyl-CoA reductase-like NADH-dependent reductase (Old Yellow Enzyme family)/thioredoxin reductase
MGKTSQLYPNLFKPLKVGTAWLKNRVIAAPIIVFFGASPLDNLEQIARKAKGGVSLITLGSVCVDRGHSLIVEHGATGFWFEEMDRLNEELSVIHQYGAKASIELFHAGMWATPPAPLLPVGPIARKRDIGKDIDHVQIEAMTEDLMAETADSYARSAVEAKKMGYDACMLHFAHGWLPAQFLSPYFNKRTDQYGGSFENRIRFPTMIVDRVREAVGPDFILDMRISGTEWIEGGIETGEVIRFVKSIENKINLIHVSAGIDKFMETTVHMITPNIEPRMPNIHLSRAMKEAVHIPVITVGGILLPEEAEKIIADGYADAVAVCRALIADPEWPNKARDSRPEDIVPCLRCTWCYHVSSEGKSQGCAVNPRHGRYARLAMELKKAETPQKVVVIGGGPAGMQAALAAAEFGHQVILFEKDPELGGLLRYAELEDGKEELRGYKRYLVRKTLESGIDIRVNTEATPELVESLAADKIIIAIGSEPVIPNIPGIGDFDNVMGALEAVKNKEKIGGRVLILGGGQIGCELALDYAKQGKNVTIVEMTDKLVGEATLIYKESLRQQFDAAATIQVFLCHKCVKIDSAGATIAGPGGEKSIPADTVIYAVGMRALKNQAESFMDCSTDVRIIGDCVRARKVNEAVHEGFFAGATV